MNHKIKAQKIKLTRLFRRFTESERTVGLVLVACAVVSLILSNSSIGASYTGFFHTEIAGHSLEHWINDGLMTIFFLLIGLELEREIYIGELSQIKNSVLPIVAAIGGMLVPAGFYLWFNFGSPTQSGAGIPMATDIAFALGILSLVGSKVPASLKVFLTALAVIDDLGAILIIAIFYTNDLSWAALGIAMGIFVVLLILNRLKVRNLIPYLLGGVAMWYFMLHSGVHATITGVLLAFAIPFGNGDKKSTSYILQDFLHKPVAFIILPIFAFANTAIILSGSFSELVTMNYSLGIITGLLLGKPIGIFLFSFLAVSIGLCKLPRNVNWPSLASVGFLGGIGFTMSIFITLLAFKDPLVINNAKLIILIASSMAGILGYSFLKLSLKRN